MRRDSIETDYLVIGAGTLGMGFVDTLIDNCDADVVMIDRRHRPGGHWLDSYPFVQLHQPSTNYGVNSTSLGQDRIEPDGRDGGFYERAAGTEICAYYDEIMRHRLLASGRVRFFPMCEYLGDRRFRSLVTGAETDVTVRTRVVDATYMQSRVPATEPPPFAVADGVTCVPVGELTKVQQPPAGYVIVGGGKTAMDAVCWLLDRGTDPDDITWIRPQDSWILNRKFFQPGAGVVPTFEGVVLELEAVAECDSIEEVYARLEEREVVFRIDPSVEPAILKGATSSRGELEQLRRIENVVRLGHVERIDLDTITLEQGSIPTSADHLHVHCASPGLADNPPRPIFTDDTHHPPDRHPHQPPAVDRAHRPRRGVGAHDRREEPALPAEPVAAHAVRLGPAPLDRDEDRDGVAERPRRRRLGGSVAPQSREGHRTGSGQGQGRGVAGSLPRRAVPRVGEPRRCSRPAPRPPSARGCSNPSA